MAAGVVVNAFNAAASSKPFLMAFRTFAMKPLFFFKPSVVKAKVTPFLAKTPAFVGANSQCNIS